MKLITSMFYFENHLKNRRNHVTDTSRSIYRTTGTSQTLLEPFTEPRTLLEPSEETWALQILLDPF